MNKIIIALALGLATSTTAFASSNALDAYKFPAQQGSIALAVDGTNSQVEQARLGDGSPSYVGSHASVDYTATAAVVSARPLGISPRAL